MRSTGASSVVAALLVAGTALLVTSPAAAQEGDAAEGHEPRSGFWLSGGLGGGVDDGGSGGGGAYLRLGGTLAPDLVLGGDIVTFARDQGVAGADDIDVTRSNVTASLLYYPSEEGDLFLKGGVGFARRELSQDQRGVTVTAEESGVGITLGAGYDVQLGDGNFFLTPNVDVLLQGFDDFAILDDGLLLLTVGLGFR